MEHSIIFFATNVIMRTVMGEMSRRGNAYLDPGSGSYLLQLLLAGFVGALFFIRMSWDRIKGFFQKFFNRQGNGDVDEE
jgi:hypothetical protein